MWFEMMIETENLRRKFGNLTAVDNVIFKVDQGEIFGFLGPNGGRIFVTRGCKRSQASQDNERL
jgi:ABC-type uncharacterized transport system ATPase subunit